MVHLVVLNRLLRVTMTKKEVINFFEEKSAPLDKIVPTPMSGTITRVVNFPEI